jgi:hypothetical protein
VHHEHPAQNARTHAPARGPYVLAFAILVQKGDVERAGEVLAEKMAGAALQRFAIGHERLDAVCGVRAREALGR